MYRVLTNFFFFLIFENGVPTNWAHKNNSDQTTTRELLDYTKPNLAYEKQTYIELSSSLLHNKIRNTKQSHRYIKNKKRVMSHTYDFQWQRQSEE